MAGISGASLTPIYNRLNSALQYHPLDAETFADWSLEAGDVVTFTRDGTDYETPVYSTNLKWRKKQEISISSTGQEKRTSVAKMSQRKFSGGKSGLINTQRTYELIETSYNGMRAGLELSSSAAHLYVDNMYAQMKSGLMLSTSTAKLYVDNKYAQMQSGLMLTASSAWLYVDNKYAQMQSGLTLTASSAKLYVDNKYLQMQSGLQLTSSSAMLYTQNRTTRAYIMTRINADGEGEALIDADKVKITGTTTIGDVFYIDDNRLNIGVNTRISGNVMCSSLTIRGASDEGTIGATDIEGIIKSASVSPDGTTLMLTPIRGDPITFRKAASGGTFSGSWSGRTFTVVADPQGSTRVQTSLYNGLVPTGSVTKSGKTVYRDFIVYTDDDGEAGQLLMQKNIGINAGTVWNDGWDAAYGFVSLPSAGTSTTFSVTVPKSDRSGGESKTFTITKGATPASSGYASVSISGTVVGRISIGDWYSSGYDTGKSDGNTAAGVTGSWTGATYKVTRAANTATKSLSCTVTISPTQNQTLDYGGSVTVYARGNTENKASVTISAKGNPLNNVWRVYLTSDHTADNHYNFTLLDRDGNQLKGVTSATATSGCYADSVYRRGYDDGYSAGGGGSSYAHSAYLTRYYAGVNPQIIPGKLYRRTSSGSYTAIGSDTTYWFGTSTNIGSTKTVHYN